MFAKVNSPVTSESEVAEMVCTVGSFWYVKSPSIFSTLPNEKAPPSAEPVATTTFPVKVEQDPKPSLPTVVVEALHEAAGSKSANYNS